MKITDLYICPIKSLCPVRVERARLRPGGAEHDRRFMLLKAEAEADGTTDRYRYRNMQVVRFPECALFRQAIVAGDRDGDVAVVVRYHVPDVPLFPPVPEQRTELRVPLEPSTAGLDTVTVKLFGSDTRAYRMGPRYDAWFSACFGYEAVLVYIGDQGRDVLAHSPSAPPPPQTSPSSWLSSITSLIPGSGLLPGQQQQEQEEPREDRKGARHQLAFSEAAPFLVTSAASLRDVSARLPDGEAMQMVRFRPNIVVDSSSSSSSSTIPSPPSPLSEEDREREREKQRGPGQNREHEQEQEQELAAWDEDFWAELSVRPPKEGGDSRDRRRRGGLLLALTANCGRCASINVDYGAGRPAAGAAGAVLRALMRDRRVDRGNRWSPVFGRYAFLLLPLPSGTIDDHHDDHRGEEEEEKDDDENSFEVAVGDEVTVTRRNPDRDVWAWPKT
ncbi:hypothetical protein GGR56DRAFT_39405 [Xylariaceae sp. FL0804]|nr:hypothetical protein GGR56DRAFT_39405 [Xylariaceae sp. FL0804]